MNKIDDHYQLILRDLKPGYYSYSMEFEGADLTFSDFFLWSASLLGVIRKQNAIAGSVRDIDIAMIFDKKKHLNFLLSLKKEFKLRFHNNYNAVQLFHEYGTIDISLFKRVPIDKYIFFFLGLSQTFPDLPFPFVCISAMQIFNSLMTCFLFNKYELVESI